MSSQRFKTVDDVCDFIRRNSLIGQWRLDWGCIRTLDGFCPVCWIAKQINPNSQWLTQYAMAMRVTDWPIEESLVPMVVAVADSTWWCDLDDRKKLLAACGLT